MIKPFKTTADSLRRYISFNYGIYYSVVLGLFICISSSLFISKSLFAEDKKKVMILNSDMSIYKYSLAHTEFKSKMAGPAYEIDLGSKWTDETKVANTIYEMDPKVIYCIGSKAYILAHKLAKDKKLIFALVINWRRFPMDENTYGIPSELPQNMQLMMHRYLFPEINKIGVLYSKAYHKEWLNIAIESGKDVEIDVIGRPISKSGEIEQALNELLPKVDALWLIPDPIVINKIESVKKIFKQSKAAMKPVLAYDKVFVNFGAALVISADISTMAKQAAGLTLDILADQKITERIQNPAGTHIILNMKKVKEYGINLNIDALDSVNEIIK